MRVLIAERARGGPFSSLEDFLQRMDARTLNKKQFENLVAAGAFDSLNPDRAQLFEAAEKLVHFASAMAEERQSSQNSLFAMEQNLSLAMITKQLDKVAPWSPLEKLSYEFGAIGFYLSAHPLDSKAAQLERMRIVRFNKLDDMLADRPVCRVQMAGILLKKSEKISAKSGNKFAFLTLSDSSGVYEVMLFSEILTRSREFLEIGKSLLITADAEQKEDQIRLTVQDIKPLDDMLDHRVHEIELWLDYGPDKVLDHAQQIEKLKNLLEGAAGGNSHFVIKILSPATQKLVRIKLCGRYHISNDLRHELYRLPGLRALNES